MSESTDYYVPEPSYWPIIATIALFIIFLGAALTFNVGSGGAPILVLGFVMLGVVFFGWFGDVIKESENGVYLSLIHI